MTDHTAHDHPNTSAARAKCRRQLERLLEAAIQAGENYATQAMVAAADADPAMTPVSDSYNLDSYTVKMSDLKMGMRVHFEKLISYSSTPGHPEYGYCWECKSHSCTKGRKVGTYEHIEGEITELIMWADNSSEVVITDAEGKKHRKMIDFPHGDICY